MPKPPGKKSKAVKSKTGRTSRKPERVAAYTPPRVELLTALQQLAPEAFSEGRLDADRLIDLVGKENTDAADAERYYFTWAGRREAEQVRQRAPFGALSPCPEESVDFDSTANIYIEADNLEALKLLNRAYAHRIKMVYIDPPYNTGNDFIYPDKFGDTLDDYLRQTGQLDEKGKVKRAGARAEAKKVNGHKHSRWLSMMFPRLFFARSLLSEDGVIFVSIDDNEVHHLRMLMNMVFGEENFVAQLPTIMNLKGNQDEFAFAGTHEYTLVFAMDRNKLIMGQFEIGDEEILEWETDDHGFFKKGATLKATGVNAPREKRRHLFFPLYVGEVGGKIVVKTTRWADSNHEIFPITDGREMSWRWRKEKIDAEPHNIIAERHDLGYVIHKKQRPGVGDLPSRKPKTFFYRPEYSSGNGTRQLRELLGRDRICDNPKPLDLIKDFVKLAAGRDGTVLDFFSGSATTAHAVMALNAEDSGNRRCISVQLPEPCDEESEAKKAGYKTIADIGKERIRRAGKKVHESLLGNGLDTGFRVFKLVRSNIVPAPTENPKTDQEWLEAQKRALETLLPDAKPETLLFEIMLAEYFPLDCKIEQIKVKSAKVFKVTDAAREQTMHVCLDKTLPDRLPELLALKQTDTLICRDDAFASDSQMTNFGLRCALKVV